MSIHPCYSFPQIKPRYETTIHRKNTSEEARGETVLNTSLFLMMTRTSKVTFFVSKLFSCGKSRGINTFVLNLLQKNPQYLVLCQKRSVAVSFLSFQFSQFSHFTFQTPLTHMTKTERRLCAHVRSWFPTSVLCDI